MARAISLNKKGLHKACDFLIKNDKEVLSHFYNLGVAVAMIEVKAVEKRSYELSKFESNSGRPELLSFADDDFNYKKKEV